LSWYPNNAVLRAITPASLCRPLEIFPVKLTQEAILVNVSTGKLGTAAKGGAGTSIENNNVFAVQPTVYFEGMDPAKEAASVMQDGPQIGGTNPAVIILGVAAVASSAAVVIALLAYAGITGSQ
jgi:hypothetical protein